MAVIIGIGILFFLGVGFHLLRAQDAEQRSQIGWQAFQTVVIAAVLCACIYWRLGQGYAPTVYAVAIALVATLGLSYLFDSIRRLRRRAETE
jgi:hypothetical protein